MIEKTNYDIFIVYIKYHELHHEYVHEAQILVTGEDGRAAIAIGRELFETHRKGFMTCHKLLETRAKRIELPLIIRM